MKLQRNLGNLATREEGLPWYARLLNKYIGAAPNSVPMDMTANRDGWIQLRPSLSGKIFRPDMTRLHPEQKTRLRDLLAQNIDVGMLASPFHGHVMDCGVLSTRVVTNTGVLFLAGCFGATAGISAANLKFHGFGTGTAAEGVTQTALQTEFTTEYAVDSTRPTGTQSNTGSMPAVYTTIATFSPDSGGTLPVTEHGIFAGATGANVMWDRSVFAAVNLVSGADSLQVTYNLTLTAGG